MKRIDIDELTKDYIEPKPPKKHFLAPDWPFRALITGETNGGKTWITLEMILKMIHFDKLYVYSKSLHQSKYRYLQDFFAKVDAKINAKLEKEAEKLGLDPPEPYQTAYFSDEISGFKLEDLDVSKMNLIVIDDFLADLNKPQNKNIIESLFIRSRHFNVSVMMLLQCSFTALPKVIRHNTSLFIFLSLPSRRMLQSMAQDLALDFEPKEFLTLFKECLCEKYSFFWLDRNQTELPLKYRKGYDGLLVKRPTEDEE